MLFFMGSQTNCIGWKLGERKMNLSEDKTVFSVSTKFTVKQKFKQAESVAVLSAWQIIEVWKMVLKSGVYILQ
jgi:hypothetical protein